MSAGEEELAFQLKAQRIEFVREFTFAKPRRWRFDFVLVNTRLAIEVEGGAFNGGHRRGIEADKDCEKSNAAVMAGWNVLRFTPKMVSSGEAIKTIEEALSAR